VWILADVHAGADPAGDDALIALLDRAIVERRDLLLLGDLFAAWLGDARFHTPLQRQVVALLRKLRAEGARTLFAAGNRDYFVTESQGVFDRVFDEDVVPLGGIPTLVTHGDQLNRDDRAYLAWRALSRSGAARALAHALPGPAIRGLAARLEKGLSTTNQAYKTGALPIAALEALGRRAQGLGARRALVGHFHHDRTLDVAGGVPVVIAPAWLDHRRILVVEPDGRLVSTAPFDAP